MQADWNLMQVLAWVFMGDRSIVAACADNAVPPRFFTEERVAETVECADGSFETWPVGRRVMLERVGDRPDPLYLSLRAAYRGGSAVASITEAERQVFEALRGGRLRARGLANGFGDLTLIPADAWSDLKFWYAPDCAGPHDPFRAGATRWTKLTFQRSEVIVIWPDPLEELLTILPTERRSSSLPPTALPLLLIARKWLSENSGAVLKEDELAQELVTKVCRGEFQFPMQPSEVPVDAAGLRPATWDVRLSSLVESLDRFGEPRNSLVLTDYLGTLRRVHGITDGFTMFARDIYLTEYGLRRWCELPDVIDWTRVRGLARPSWIGPVPEAPRGSTGKIVLAEARECRRWLADLMRAGPSGQSKADYRKQALARFRISARAFNRAWDGGIEDSGNTEWSRPGRKSKRPVSKRQTNS